MVAELLLVRDAESLVSLGRAFKEVSGVELVDALEKRLGGLFSKVEAVLTTAMCCSPLLPGFQTIDFDVCEESSK